MAKGSLMRTSNSSTLEPVGLAWQTAGKGHKWVTVLHNDRQNQLAGRAPCGVWESH